MKSKILSILCFGFVCVWLTIGLTEAPRIEGEYGQFAFAMTRIGFIFASYCLLLGLAIVSKKKLAFFWAFFHCIIVGTLSLLGSYLQLFGSPWPMLVSGLFHFTLVFILDRERALFT